MADPRIGGGGNRTSGSNGGSGNCGPTPWNPRYNPPVSQGPRTFAEAMKGAGMGPPQQLSTGTLQYPSGLQMSGTNDGRGGLGNWVSVPLKEGGGRANYFFNASGEREASPAEESERRQRSPEGSGEIASADDQNNSGEAVASVDDERSTEEPTA